MAVTIVPTPASVNSSSKQRVRHPAVEDVGAARRRCARRGGRRPTFGIIPPPTRAVAEQACELVGGDGWQIRVDRVVAVPPQPLDVGQVDQLLGAERLGDRPGDRVGVDVVGLAGLVGADRGHDRDQLLGEEALEDRRVDRRHVADEAELGPSAGAPG